MSKARIKLNIKRLYAADGYDPHSHCVLVAPSTFIT